ncbi:prolow-density lipoprotein receptor-related protein 1-like [Macrobrachium nipponense]|uniref:prolow-density lipoprotein receptor-related protein 1-like n=1 Tax=Macrobrachium nipponense TaxID=159736 RepID=UPI0030C87E16
MAPKLWYLCILWVSTASILAVELDPCEPDCTSASPFDKVEDPYDCTQFYFCLADHTPADHSVPCPAGTAFNPDDGDCTGAVPCESLCGGGGGGGCHLTCNGTGDVISDPFNCNIFYECDAAGPQPPRTCPADRPYFDGTNCVNDEAVCCIPSCEPSCEAAATQVPDPRDCSKFYICMEAGTPDESLHFSCPSGQTFDIGTGHCSASAECKILCPGSTTSPVSPSGPSESSTSSSGCIDSLTCTGQGVFAKCNTCVPEYFFCKAAGDAGEQKECTKGKVFNPVPEFPSCILPGNCPYYP